MSEKFSVLSLRFYVIILHSIPVYEDTVCKATVCKAILGLTVNWYCQSNLVAQTWFLWQGVVGLGDDGG